MTTSLGIRSIVARWSGTVNGQSPTRLPSSGRARSGVEIHNADPARRLWIAVTHAHAAPPVLSAISLNHAVAPGETLALAYGESIDLWLMHDGGDASSSPYSALEVAA